MTAAVNVVRDLLAGIEPVDEVERAHLAEAVAWVARTEDVFRRAPPATPPRHLVSYVVVVDPAGDAVFLVDHVKAGLWLPPGGHVEVGEHPALSAGREVEEELGIRTDLDAASRPVFLTITTTVNIDSGHEDVSLWFVTTAGRETVFTLDPTEFRSGRWWGVAEIEAADPARFDPHLRRFLRKVRGSRPAG
ncbi:NUDIX domain-containing protein [Nocardia takedensis]|uniref:NUDIX domain-containing protein n=1 Tax=Nocardia takedensis TaxID=259390 RepID=UPI00031481B1|nr:NUDIX domain-containing protein [Nocardia takedensis]